ncbi:MAG TPA: glutamate-5-semialdehyde dehydrogenase [Sandaracinaceae bacterium LLY-WYZ-13_1]|nr:glutamate-5-semialdehyde dehydrogenase [Sandaracinaceae bacterium LLY-WYZ-13_1]
MTELREQVTELARRAKAAARVLAPVDTARKDAVLHRVAAGLRAPESDAVLDANVADVQAGEEAGLSGAMLDRLRLDRARLDGVADAVAQIVRLPDPVGQVVESRRLANGLSVGRVRVPLGLVGIIYESRPNVTVDAAALCFKAGNACLLRGGKEAFRTNRALAAIFAKALEDEGFDPATVSLLPTVEREATRVMIELDSILDVIIPRGGEGLIRFVAENARVPVIRHYKGVCHVYVDADADPAMAERIAVNAKTHRPGVCNAMETLLVDAAAADALLPRLAEALSAKGVELRGDARARAVVPSMAEADEADWDAEYLDLICAVAVVDGIDGALAHVAVHGSQHTEAIVTESYARAERWLREVDASLVLVNASTRFNDGGQLGLGAEVGISTTKLHSYGPMGLAELCALKWVGRGEGQIRE